ncbi:MAG: histidine phosphatase family protein, partial [Actinomycetota bacterium]|nr:histidine phosphatase family protein [Actinomycetota bacterium]
MIWLLRHGDAEDAPPGGDDAARELTEKGRRQSRDAGRALAKLGVRFDACIASPRTRARETAALACEALGLEVEIDERLRGGDFDPGEIAAGRGEVLLVGHEPDFSMAVQDLTGARIEFKKSGIAAVDDRRLLRLLRPADL